MANTATYTHGTATPLTASELSLAIQASQPDCGFERVNPELFRVFYPSSFGGVIDRDATVAEIGELLPLACVWAHADMASLVGWLNTLIPDGWAPDRHALGAVIDRRTVEKEGFAFFSGPGTYQEEQVLVRVDRAPEYFPDYYEQVDPPRKSWESIQIGDTIWISADRPHILPPIVVPEERKAVWKAARAE